MLGGAQSQMVLLLAMSNSNTTAQMVGLPQERGDQKFLHIMRYVVNLTGASVATQVVILSASSLLCQCPVLTYVLMRFFALQVRIFMLN